MSEADFQATLEVNFGVSKVGEFEMAVVFPPTTYVPTLFNHGPRLFCYSFKNHCCVLLTAAALIYR